MRTFMDSPELYQVELEQIIYFGGEGGLQGRSVNVWVRRGYKGKVWLDPIFRNKEKFEPGAKTEGTEPIKTLASGELPGIEVSHASIHYYWVWQNTLKWDVTSANERQGHLRPIRLKRSPGMLQGFVWGLPTARTISPKEGVKMRRSIKSTSPLGGSKV